MDGVFIPFLPAGTWLVASTFLLLLLLVVYGYHIYYRSRVRAMIGDSSNMAALSARKELLQGDVTALREWIDGQKGELSLLEGERHQQELVRAELSQLEQALATKRQESEDFISKLGDLENQTYLKRIELEALEREVGDLTGKKAEAAALDRQLEDLRREVENLKDQAGRTAELEAKYTALSMQTLLLEQSIAEHKQILEPLRDEKVKTKEWLAKARQEVASERETHSTLQQQANMLKKDITALSMQTHLLEQNIAEHKQTLEPLRDEKIKTQEWLAKARQAVASERETHSTLQQQANMLKQEINELAARKESLAVEMEKLRGELSGTPSDSTKDNPYADLLQVEPACLARGEFEAPARENDESGLLRQFRDALRHDGFFFSERVVDAFHTSLKCHDINPLTVLAGVSGTGKTLLPIRYAEFMGIHRLVMAVQPRWDSPQDMFGFYNYLEKKYKASELSRSLVRMDPYNYKEDFKGKAWPHERMLLVLLDEMNLARTEYYFSEFLSKLELRRMVEDPSSKEKRSQAELEFDAGPGSRRFRVWVPPNIFFVGTMNEDETTQTLSDKVLDRSNVLRFGKPDEKTAQSHTYSMPTTRKSFLPYATWKSWIKSTAENDWQKEVDRWVGDLNEALDGVGRPFGFRVRQAISTYIANYPRAGDDNRYKLAFADQIEQKILPKLRGLDIDESAATLNKVGSLIKSLGDAPLEEAFRKAQQESKALGMFQWRGVTRQVGDA